MESNVSPSCTLTSDSESKFLSKEMKEWNSDLTIDDDDNADDYLNDLEVLLSSPSHTTYDPISEELALLPATERIQSSVKSKICNTNSLHHPSYLYSIPPVNAVHMVLQENSKVPNNYKHHVDRSPAVGFDAAEAAANVLTTYRADSIILNEIAKLSQDQDGDWKPDITEAFFAPEQRSSAAAAYSNARALTNSYNSSDMYDALLYGRNVPLPIPEPSSSATAMITKLSSSSLEDTNTVFTPDETSTPSQRPNETKELQHQCQHNSSLNILGPPAVVEASKLRSQFGFGLNHVVPSVPVDPTSSSTQSVFGYSVKHVHTKNHCKETSVKVLNPMSISANVNDFINAAGPSYERKKQKAKDARVKLNDSIDKLSTAINLAGSQSKLRLTQFQSYFKSNPTYSHDNGNNITSTATPKIFSQCHNSKQLANTIRIMEEVYKTAESAKKWDRPSFVGSAAIMIQALNAQCECLMAELLSIQSYIASDQHEPLVTPSSSGDGIPPLSIISSNISSTTVISSDSSFNDKDGHEYHVSSKRRRLSTEDSAIESKSIKTILDSIRSPQIFNCIISFLPPTSLLRFQAVSKACRQAVDWSIGDYWMIQCYNRFGTFNVRRSLESEDGKAETSPAQFQDYMNLYKHMNSANVRPRCLCEGDLYLGEGKVDNILSGWVSAVVRSNGETLRSVQRDCGKRLYSSLPVVELRIHLQNTGFSDGAVCIPEQIFSVDSSTKRRGEEMFEITSDNRLRKKVLRLDGSPGEVHTMDLSSSRQGGTQYIGDLCKLNLFESVVLVVHIHARQCPTTEKFRQKTNFMRLLFRINGTTVPLVIPFLASPT